MLNVGLRIGPPEERLHGRNFSLRVILTIERIRSGRNILRKGILTSQSDASVRTIYS